MNGNNHIMNNYTHLSLLYSMLSIISPNKCCQMRSSSFASCLGPHALRAAGNVLISQGYLDSILHKPIIRSFSYIKDRGVNYY